MVCVFLYHCTSSDMFPVVSNVFDGGLQPTAREDNFYSTVNISQRNLLLPLRKQTSGTVSECSKQPVLQDNPSYFFENSSPPQSPLLSANPACDAVPGAVASAIPDNIASSLASRCVASLYYAA